MHVHPNFQSPPSKDVISGITNGGISRSPPLSKFPPHPSESGRQEPSVTTAYSSIYSTNNQLDRRSPVRNLGSVLSTIPSSTSFVNDSLEVGGVPRLSRNEPLVTTALGHRPAVANNSGNQVVWHIFGGLPISMVLATGNESLSPCITLLSWLATQIQIVTMYYGSWC